MGRLLWAAKIVYGAVRPVKQRYIAKLACNYYKGSTDHEIREVMSYVAKSGRMEMINYPFMEQYKTYSCAVKKDKQCGLFYVNYYGRRMYFSREYFSAGRCLEYLRSILSEQDKNSPHRYLSDGFDVTDGSVVVDAGAAEGNFSLGIVDRVSKLVLVECDKYWIAALERTFAKEISEGKVVIMPKMLGDKNTKKEVTLDALYEEYGKIDFLKMDIEGGEEKALRGGVKWLEESQSAKLAVCAYHNSGAFRAISRMLKENEGKQQLFLTHSKGYMCCNTVFDFKPPYLRRGIIRAVIR